MQYMSLLIATALAPTPCALWAEAGRPLKGGGDVAEYALPPLGAPPSSGPEWRLVRAVDCAEEAPVSDVGGTRAIDHPAGAFREAGARKFDRFAYVFKLSGPDRLVRLMEYAPHRRLVETGFDLDALLADERIVLERHPGYNPYRGEEANTTPKVLYDYWILPPPLPPMFRGGAVSFHQGYRESHAVLDLGDKNAPKLMFPEPWKKEAMGRACQLTPWGRHFLRDPVRSFYFFDPDYLAIGGFSIGTSGAEDEWRELVTAFQALPAVRFDDVGCTGRVMVRTAQAEDSTWVYAVNFTDAEAPLSLQVSAADLRNAVTGQQTPLTDGVLETDLPPYALRVRRCGAHETVALNQPSRPPVPEQYYPMAGVSDP